MSSPFSSGIRILPAARLRPLSEALADPHFRNHWNELHSVSNPYSISRWPTLLGATQYGAVRVGVLHEHLLAECQDAVFGTRALFVGGADPLSDAECHWLRDLMCAQPSLRVLVAEPCCPLTDQGFEEQFLCTPSDAHHEYLLSTHHIAAAPSPGLRRKHAAAARFTADNPTAYFTRIPKTSRIARDFVDRVCHEDELTSPQRARDSRAFRHCLDDTYPASIECHAVLTGNQILALQVSECPEGETFFAHFCRYVRRFRGIYDFFVISLIKHALDRAYQYYNLSEDLGLPNMRQGKQHWEPARLLRIFELSVAREN